MTTPYPLSLFNGDWTDVRAHSVRYRFTWAYVDFGDHEDAVPQVTIELGRSRAALPAGERFRLLLLPESPLNPDSGICWVGRTAGDGLAWAHRQRGTAQRILNDVNAVLAADPIYEGRLDTLPDRWRFDRDRFIRLNSAS